MTSNIHLQLDKVSKTYSLGHSGFGGDPRFLRAVDNVSLDIMQGEILGLVGESGCGKSSLARLIVQLETLSSGAIELNGVDLSRLNATELKAARRDFQMIFQDPYASLSPRMNARAIIAEALINYNEGSRTEIDARVDELATLVGLSRFHLDQFPHELSGGQCQRIGIARAIALGPGLLVADEPVSALDVSIQAQILNLIIRLQAEMGLTLLFISHDLSVVAHVADRVAVMYLGRIVEIGETSQLFEHPAHPYTRTLLAAAPRPTPESRRQKTIVKGELPSPLNPPSGCHFRTRCTFADERCAAEPPNLISITNNNQCRTINLR